jgi:hypothetical protein
VVSLASLVGAVSDEADLKMMQSLKEIKDEPEANLCQDGSHGCDEESTQCYEVIGGYYLCVCKAGFSDIRSDPHECDPIAGFGGGDGGDGGGVPSIAPTVSPTTTHPCSFGDHGCDTATTMCIPVYTQYICKCLPGYSQVHGDAHTCETENAEFPPPPSPSQTPNVSAK